MPKSIMTFFREEDTNFEEKEEKRKELLLKNRDAVDRLKKLFNADEDVQDILSKLDNQNVNTNVK